MRLSVVSFLSVLFIIHSVCFGWQAGTAKTIITPDDSIWLAGYAGRSEPARGAAQELWGKALALEDDSGKRLVLVTLDLLGTSAELTRRISRKAGERYNLERSAILFNSSHTHSGPVLDGVLEIAYQIDEEQWQKIRSYTRKLEDQLVDLIGSAIENLTSARISYGTTRVGFAVNRRVETPNGYVIGVNSEGPVDHTVPVLRVEDSNGEVRAVVFGYACHNTTGTGGNLRYHGDYAGSAQKWLEERNPGMTALFVTGAGADANPVPRGTLELADTHGVDLGRAVEDTLVEDLMPLESVAAAAYTEVDLEFDDAPGREEFEQRLNEDNIYRVRHAREMLKIINREGSLPGTYPYPIQVWRLGNRLTLVALAGEVVIDYSLRLKGELGEEGLWVAGYSNDVPAYIPSRRILREGGYEADTSMLYYGKPSRFATSIEDTIVETVHKLIQQVANRP